MESIEVITLLKNLLKRIETHADGTRHLSDVLTDDELDALKTAITQLSNHGPASGVFPPAEPVEVPAFPVPQTLQKQISQVSSKPLPKVHLNLSALNSPEPPKNIRLCLDFGTATSKVTLVNDNDETDSEEIHVLHLGVPGDQEEISEVMLISSVYIDNAGMLWFGKAAMDRSMVEGGDGSRQRLDNIKRRLSEDGWDEQVGTLSNPTGLSITNGDMVLAYLTYLTWAVNHCLSDLSYPSNLLRRFAMPCLSAEKGRETVHRLRKLIGEAKVLADTFDSEFKDGIPLGNFVAAVHELRQVARIYPFVGEDITEPLGVAGSMLSWKNRVDLLIMVVDIGAGTSDLSLYRILFDPATGENTAIEIEGSSRGLTEAGNYLDRLLIELIIKKSRITSDDPVWVNVRSALELQIRDFKETLFNDQSVLALLMNGIEVNIKLDEFLQMDQVRGFGENLRSKMVEVLESIDPSWVGWIKANPTRNLVVALTGGGSALPMVKSLAEGKIVVNGSDVSVARALPLPDWLRKIDENLEVDYPRIAVSLGGARRRLIQRGKSAHITAGDVAAPPKLGGYYQKGS